MDQEGAEPGTKLGAVGSFELPGEYRRWNRVLADFFLLRAEPDQDVILCVAPSTLSRALDVVEDEALSPDDAQRDFKRAVASMYSEFVLMGGHSIGGLSAEGDDGIPQSIAFLGLSVLAAFDQERDPEVDEKMGKLPYYRFLSRALECQIIRNLPEGFDPDAFDGLWNSLSYWVLETLKAVLDLPPSDGGHIAYPHRHVLLRQVDIDKLPVMFEREGFEPWSRSISDNRMGRALASYSSLTENAKKALGDKRRQGVIEQALAVLEAWDGSVETGTGARKAPIQIHLWFERDIPLLSYLPSRPSGFPDPFETSAGVALEAEDGPYYSSIPIEATDGRDLEDGFEWKAGRFTLRRPAARILALPQANDLSGFLSQQGLHRGRTSAVLCVEELREEVTAHLEAITGRQLRPLSDNVLPQGWILFRDVIPKAVADLPDGLEALDVSESISVDFVGGIRLERGRTWLKGSTPSVFVTPPDASVTVNGSACTLVEGKVVTPALRQTGRHVITVGRVTRRMNVTEAMVSDDCVPLLTDADGIRIVLALPHGEWTLLGSHPREVGRVECTAMSGVFACEFRPVWAVRYRSGRGRWPILCLVDDPSPPLDAELDSDCRPWCNAVRWAQEHRAGFERLGPTAASVPDAQGVWSRYVAQSKRLRRHRGRHR